MNEYEADAIVTGAIFGLIAGVGVFLIQREWGIGVILWFGIVGSLLALAIERFFVCPSNQKPK